MPSAQSEDAMNVWTRLVFVHFFFKFFFFERTLFHDFVSEISVSRKNFFRSLPFCASVLSEVYSLLYLFQGLQHKQPEQSRPKPQCLRFWGFLAMPSQWVRMRSISQNDSGNEKMKTQELSERRGRMWTHVVSAFWGSTSFQPEFSVTIQFPFSKPKV